MNAFIATVRLTKFTFLYFLLDLLFALLNFLALPVVMGLLAQTLFNEIAGNKTMSAIIAVVVAIVALQVGSAASGYFLLAPWSPMQQKAQVLLRRNLFSAILGDYGRHDFTASPGDVVSRFRDDPPLIADILDCVCDLIGRSAFIVAAAVLMWRIDPVVTLVLAVPVGASTLLTLLASNRIRRLRTSARVASSDVSSWLGDIMAGQLSVKVAGASGHVVDRLVRLGDERREAEVRDTVFGALMTGINLNMGNIGTALVLLAAAGSIASGRFTVGDIALFVVYTAAINWFPDEVSRLIGGLRQVEVSMARMHALAPGTAPMDLVATDPLGKAEQPLSSWETPPPAGRATVSTEAPRESDTSLRGTGDSAGLKSLRLEILEVDGLTYRHPLSGKGISDVSFILPRGTLTVVTGPIGSGKSTMLRVLLGLLPAESGRVLWNGEEVLDPPSFLVPPRVSYTPQVPRLFTESVRENILLGWPASEGILSSAVEDAILGPDLAAMDSGLNTRVGPRGIRLSGGQVQRVAAARMFVRDTELLVIDDVSSALDAHTESEMWDRFLSRIGERACLVVSHQRALLRRADQVLVMSEGVLENRQ